jgi:hypothetical protein
MSSSKTSKNAKARPGGKRPRKSTEHNLDLEFNSLDAQREACEAYIKSQAHEGWRLVPDRYDDGAFSGASLDCPAALAPEFRFGCLATVLRRSSGLGRRSGCGESRSITTA